jgi:hypothetical protein
MFLGVQKIVREWTLTLPNELSFWELESKWIPKSSKSDYKGQNLMDWNIPNIIGKILEVKCLKWLTWPIWTFETQVMAKRRAERQIGNLTPTH